MGLKKAMKRKSPRRIVKVNSGSMADIAFLLLIFFLVTTTIINQQGLNLKLPPDEKSTVPINERNLFKVLVNSNNIILVEEKEFINHDQLKSQLKTFILNNGKDPTLSDNPEKAIVSLKVNRGTNYEVFISMLDALQGTYYEIYGDRMGITSKEFRNLDLSNPKIKSKYLAAREGIPMNISIAEPSKTN